MVGRIPTGTRSARPAPWQNWAGTERCHPVHVARPGSVEGIAEAVRNAARDGFTVRPRGSGHSFTGVAATDGVAMDLGEWSGLVSAEGSTGLVTVRSGTPLHQLNSELDRLGLAMANLGDIDTQTVSGAISTGTHGTGARLGGLATQVRGLELVLADGSMVSCSPGERPELFSAARVGLGALGVISTVTLQCVPSFVLHAREYPGRLDEILERFDELTESEDHVEFHWFPHGDRVLVKRNTRLPAGTAPEPMSRARRFYEYELMENGAFGLVCRLGRAIPSTVPALNRMVANLVSERSYSDVSHRVFTTPRRVRFVESEYAVPRESLHEVLREFRASMPTLKHPVIVPVEVRVAAADDIPLSTAYGRDTAYIAIHQYLGMPYRDYFDRFESIVGAVGGRPHWGKMHTLRAEDLAERYPRFEDFRKVRAAVDPDGVFRNAYLDRVLGQP
ncbi:D-arabinono-1,4-lactone oxidase [Kutzneria albida]|uniref:FAD-linked oxidoreductase n=1 Tax=Kutzneria albida DSM 43870 TaxID=1449976 RepID=W5VX40_9PSEU|nr:D-arabinono-1,4-lactone oxidase [Kutzneria albida]AHH93408.1 FAD-linked oxidoreductase [Kutzneria albida DSM 43870]